MRYGMPLVLVVLGLSGCADVAKSAADARAGVTKGRAVLKKPIGVRTAGEDFTPLIAAGQRLPCTHSETFTNKTDGGPQVLVELAQQDETGLETIASLILAIPPVDDNALQITVTLKVSKDRKLRVKTTVAETASVQEFGPFPVE